MLRYRVYSRRMCYGTYTSEQVAITVARQVHGVVYDTITHSQVWRFGQTRHPGAPEE